MKHIYHEICHRIKEADAVLIGASNGLSITEGLHLFAENEEFSKLFSDFKQKYGIHCILHGMNHHWISEEEKWCFWSRLIHNYCGNYHPTPVMKDLKSIITEKDYFIVTSNGECHFEMNGFDPNKILEVEGNWLSMQCSNACHRTLYPTLKLAEKMIQSERHGKIATELVPHCPHCGGTMQIHLQLDQNFIPNITELQRYQSFLEKYHQKNLVILELGIGWRNQVIKAPLMRLTEKELNATYITINLGEIYIPEKIQNKSFGLDGYLSEILKKIRKELQNET